LVKITAGKESKATKTAWGDAYFYISNNAVATEHLRVPITYFRNDLKYAWTEATGKEISFSDVELPDDAAFVKGSIRDSLVRIMMQQSDNFIAEQLLLACSLKGLRYMSETDIIDSLMKGPLHSLSEAIKWVDGSGLSRYNQATPRSMVDVLSRIMALKGIDFMTDIFPAGGISGTLQSNYRGKNGQPYLYAKSGSMRNVLCLSGLMYTKSGKVLLFSWMNNQFPGDSAEVKTAMEKLFSFLYDHY
jgi:D-alanyl-D-alanine carboxypeptidase/D-alanyl-D-alanine-endopeptidase (penicillin-binding protein 4)